MWHLVGYGWLMLFLSHPLYAQVLSDSAAISLITYAPSDELYAAFGHSALRVRDPASSYDVLFNYGMFSFDEGNFYQKFAQGKLNYWLGSYNFSQLTLEYRVRNATICEQVFNLTTTEKQAIFDHLMTNLQPENRYYRYDFFYDNCVTRIRDVMLNVLGNRLQLDTSFVKDYSFRDLIDRYMGPQPWGDFGIDLALGARIDQRAPAIDYMFLPEYASLSFAGSTVERDGKLVPLVKDDLVLYRAHNDGSTYPFYLRPLWIFGTLLGLSIFATFAGRPTSPRYWPDVILFLVYGLVGIVILLLWIATDHTTTQDNGNLLWLHPLHIVSAGLLLRRRKTRATKRYFLINGLAYLLLLAMWNMIPQDFNLAFLPLIMLLAFRYLYLYAILNKPLPAGIIP